MPDFGYFQEKMDFLCFKNIYMEKVQFLSFIFRQLLSDVDRGDDGEADSVYDKEEPLDAGRDHDPVAHDDGGLVVAKQS